MFKGEGIIPRIRSSLGCGDYRIDTSQSIPTNLLSPEQLADQALRGYPEHAKATFANAVRTWRDSREQANKLGS